MGQDHSRLKIFRNSQLVDMAQSAYAKESNAHDNLIVRINGTLPDFSSLGSKDKSERAEEVIRKGIRANTSCSLYNRDYVNHSQQVFHMIIDIGEGVVDSIK